MQRGRFVQSNHVDDHGHIWMDFDMHGHWTRRPAEVVRLGHCTLEIAHDLDALERVIGSMDVPEHLRAEYLKRAVDAVPAIFDNHRLGRC